MPDIADISELKNWFKRFKKPTQEQFYSFLDSYHHKNSTIPEESIEGLSDAIASLSLLQTQVDTHIANNLAHQIVPLNSPLFNHYVVTNTSVDTDTTGSAIASLEASLVGSIVVANRKTLIYTYNCTKLISGNYVNGIITFIADLPIGTYTPSQIAALTFVEITESFNGAVHTTLLDDYGFVDNSADWDTAYSWGDHAGLYSLVDHAHSAFDRATLVLSDADVFSDIIVTDGIVTGIATRTLTLANLGYTGDANANLYVHPTGDGNLHVPANSTTNAGKVLTASGTAGVYTWETFVSNTYSETFGNGVDTTITITHNLGTEDLSDVRVVEIATKERVYPTEMGVDINNLNLVFSIAPTTDQYRVTITA